MRQHYDLAGQEGPTLTLIHGGWLDSSAWDDSVVQLRETMRVLTYDVRGYGATDHPLEPWTLEDWGSDLIALWDALGIEASHLLGFSMGGPIALEVALRVPDAVLSLILVSTTARFAPATRDAYRQALESEFGREQYDAALARHVDVAFSPSFHEQRPDYIEAYAARAARTPIDSVVNTMRALERVDFLDRLPRVAAPALVIHGDADRVTGGEHAEALVEGLGEVSERTIAGAGHTLHLEHPEVFAAAVAQFVDGAQR